jgi:hypothetical protein
MIELDDDDDQEMTQEILENNDEPALQQAQE